MSGDNLPIIVLGCPRSGTTLLRRILDAHPEILCPGETFTLRAAVRFLSGEIVAEGINYGPIGGMAALGVSPEELKDRLRDFVMGFHREIAERAGKPRFAIKTAINGFYIPEIIDLMRGHAKFVCLARHGMDVAVSLREFVDAMEGPIEELMPFLNQNHRAMQAYSMAWVKITQDIVDAAQAFPDDVLAIRYEDLLDSPEDTLGALFEFLGEEADIEKLLQATFRKADVQGLGDYKTFETRSLDSKRAGRWAKEPLRVQHELAPILNPLLEQLGYDALEEGAGNVDGLRWHELSMMFKSTRDEG